MPKIVSQIRKATTCDILKPQEFSVVEPLRPKFVKHM
jgi:hypothetical protein